MKAEINKAGILVIIPQSKTEEYAIEKWFDEQVNNPCRGTITTNKLYINPLKVLLPFKDRFKLWITGYYSWKGLIG